MAGLFGEFGAGQINWSGGERNTHGNTHGNADEIPLLAGAAEVKQG
ncbi:MAG: hypothetical protein ACI9OD_004891 [Limisphaerales bacterium]|jgi:hypothetical protein